MITSLDLFAELSDASALLGALVDFRDDSLTDEDVDELRAARRAVDSVFARLAAAVGED